MVWRRPRRNKVTATLHSGGVLKLDKSQLPRQVGRCFRAIHTASLGLALLRRNRGRTRRGYSRPARGPPPGREDTRSRARPAQTASRATFDPTSCGLRARFAAMVRKRTSGFAVIPAQDAHLVLAPQPAAWGVPPCKGPSSPECNAGAACQGQRSRQRAPLPGSIRATASRHRAQLSPNPPKADGPGFHSKRTTGSAGGALWTPAHEQLRTCLAHRP